MHLINIVQRVKKVCVQEALGRQTVPAGPFRERFPLHEQREAMETGAFVDDGIVQANTPGSQGGAFANVDGRHFHDTVFEQMRLQNGLFIERRFVADRDQVPFGDTQRVNVDIITNVAAHGP